MTMGEGDCHICLLCTLRVFTYLQWVIFIALRPHQNIHLRQTDLIHSWTVYLEAQVKW